MGTTQTKNSQDENEKQIIGHYYLKHDSTCSSPARQHIPVSASPAGAAAALILNCGHTPFQVSKRPKYDREHLTKKNNSNDHKKRTTYQTESSQHQHHMNNIIMDHNYFKEPKSCKDLRRSMKCEKENVPQTEDSKDNRHVSFQLPKRHHTICSRIKPKQETDLQTTAPSIVINENVSKDIDTDNDSYDAITELPYVKKATESYEAYHVHAAKMKKLMLELKQLNIQRTEENQEDQDTVSTEIFASDSQATSKMKHDQHDEIIEKLCKEIEDMNNPYGIRKAYYYL